MNRPVLRGRLAALLLAAAAAGCGTGSPAVTAVIATSPQGATADCVAGEAMAPLAPRRASGHATYWEFLVSARNQTVLARR
ncbi:hypothetical protein LE190_20885 [Massilia oculi]|uniref:Lipoprotein n=1 Tax=Massilia hydrophila TaxID=3044279 RepID=A0ABS7YHG7_9BURK|nr:hypothetical protein [Massilia oculi]MCA1858366.1 hypothetical protein [Massilia oculi]